MFKYTDAKRSISNEGSATKYFANCALRHLRYRFQTAVGSFATTTRIYEFVLEYVTSSDISLDLFKTLNLKHTILEAYLHDHVTF